MASSSANQNLCPHDRFFFSDGSLYLSVENTLYCVHRFLFEIHADMFPARDLETSLSKPYILGDVKKSDFDRLLASLYPRTLWVEEAETTQEWISILALAAKWGFKSLRSRAISKIEQTIDSPIDMVTLGRQYGIPDILLPGYAVLCQSTVPLSDEEGHRLGIKDVLKIYRIRHELYGFGITPVSLEIASAKVKETGLGTEQELDNEPASTWVHVGSVAASQTSVENEERVEAVLTSNTSLVAASTETETLVSEKHEQGRIDTHSLSDGITSVSLDKESNGTTSPGNVSNTDSGPPESDHKIGFKLLDELTAENFELISGEIMQWINKQDIKKMLQQITRLIVDKAIEEPHRSDAFARLCKLMLMIGPQKKKINKKLKSKACTVGSLFRQDLSKICRENLEAVAVSISAVGTDKQMAEIRRLNLIAFIGELAKWKVIDPACTPSIIEEWVTALLDAKDEEKVATLCMLMTRAGPFWNISWHMNCWFQRMTDVARETGNPRVRTLLQDVTMLRERDWVEAAIL